MNHHHFSPSCREHLHEVVFVDAHGWILAPKTPGALGKNIQICSKMFLAAMLTFRATCWLLTFVIFVKSFASDQMRGVSFRQVPILQLRKRYSISCLFLESRFCGWHELNLFFSLFLLLFQILELVLLRFERELLLHSV